MPETLSKIERRKVRIQSRYFALIFGKLYRRGMDGILRRCIDIVEVVDVAHDSACGGYSARMLAAHKALRAGYYWPTMFQDSYDHARKCDSCQRYSRKDVRLGMPLQASLPLVPFEKWGIDYVG